MGLFKRLFSGIAGGKTKPSTVDIAEIIGRHAYSRGIPLVADLPPGETAMSHYLKRLNGSPADEFEARLLVWLGATFGVEPVFSTGTNAGFWSFPYAGERVELSVIGVGKNTVATGMREDIPWRMRMEQAPPAAFIERMKKEFTADNPVVRNMHGRIRVQFNAAGLRPGGALARALAG